jgi:DNA-binding CsgD family transcriptional regulator
MRSASRDVHEQMMLIGELVERVCALPAVPTGDWCQRAAAETLPLAGDGPVLVGLARYDAAGEAVDLEDAGAASRNGASTVTLRSLLEPSAGGWNLPESRTVDEVDSGRILRVVDVAQLPSVSRDRWSPFRVEKLLVASDALSAGTPRRRLTVILSADGEIPNLPSVLAAVAPSLLRRATLAFGAAHGSSRGPARLTAREVEVLDRLLLGLSIKKIAEDLGRSPHTVHDHVKSLHAKLGASSRGELVARALGHIDPHGAVERNTEPGLIGSTPEEAGVGEPAVSLSPVVKPLTLAGLKL